MIHPNDIIIVMFTVIITIISFISIFVTIIVIQQRMIYSVVHGFWRDRIHIFELMHAHGQSPY